MKFHTTHFLCKHKKSRLKSGLENHGGEKGTRTLDPHTASVML